MKHWRVLQDYTTDYMWHDHTRVECLDMQVYSYNLTDGSNLLLITVIIIFNSYIHIQQR